MKTRDPGATNLAAHVYDYKPAGNIRSWAQTLGTSAAKTWAIAYDKADQLEAATQTQGTTVPAQQAFRFDRIGNITSKQDGSEISKGTHNNRNQLTAQEPGGWMRVRGTTNEGASVKVKSNANPFTNAATTSADEFSAWVQAAPGANTLTVEAKDDSPNANTRIKSWSVNITGQSRVPSYDLNGNMTANGLGQTYLWDAENRLVKITYADNSKTEFTYDGLSRRVRFTERNASNTITGDKRYLWAGGNQPAEEREANGTTVTKRYFPQGEQRIGGADAGFYYYTKDHLGSIREITNSSGALVTRYDFDLWGKRVKAPIAFNAEGLPLYGALETEVGFTGHHHHVKSGLVLTWFRAYDAEVGTWLSPDPIGEEGGMNLYAYVLSDPINGWDPLGLDISLFKPGSIDDVDSKLAGAGPTRKNVFDIDSHGFQTGLIDERAIQGQGGEVIDLEKLADEILAHKDFKPGKDIYLNSCHSGSGWKNDNGKDVKTGMYFLHPKPMNAAQMLADIIFKRTGVEQSVFAPNNYVQIVIDDRRWRSHQVGDKHPRTPNKLINVGQNGNAYLEHKCNK